MLFKWLAPVYDLFARIAKFDHSRKLPEWLSPVQGLEVLDLAGGTGINAQTLAEAGAFVTVVDSSPAMLARARAKSFPARLILSDAAQLPLPDHSMDLVLLSDAWHHFRDQTGVVREITRVLRPGGRLYIIDFDPLQKKTRFLALIERMLAEPSTFTAPEELVALLNRAGIDGTYRYLTSNQFIYQGYYRV